MLDAASHLSSEHFLDNIKRLRQGRRRLVDTKGKGSQSLESGEPHDVIIRD